MSHPHADRLVHRSDKPFHLLNASASDASDLAHGFRTRPAPKTVARFVRGKKCRTSQGFFDQVAAAFQFPPYFGDNWNALDECLADLDWLPAEAYVLVIVDAGHFLADEKPEALPMFVELIAGIAKGWSAPKKEDHHPASFQVVFQADPADQPALAGRFKAAGAVFDVL